MPSTKLIYDLSRVRRLYQFETAAGPIFAMVQFSGAARRWCHVSLSVIIAEPRAPRCDVWLSKLSDNRLPVCAGASPWCVNVVTRPLSVTEVQLFHIPDLHSEVTRSKRPARGRSPRHQISHRLIAYPPGGRQSQMAALLNVLGSRVNGGAETDTAFMCCCPEFAGFGK